MAFVFFLEGGGRWGLRILIFGSKVWRFALRDPGLGFRAFDQDFSSALAYLRIMEAQKGLVLLHIPNPHTRKKKKKKRLDPSKWHDSRGRQPRNGCFWWWYRGAQFRASKIVCSCGSRLLDEQLSHVVQPPNNMPRMILMTT